MRATANPHVTFKNNFCSLEDLVKKRKPKDLTGKATLKVGAPETFGGFASVHIGYMNGKKVCLAWLLRGQAVEYLRRLQ